MSIGSTTAPRPRVRRSFAVNYWRLTAASLCLFLIVSPASADWFYPYVEYVCDQDNDRLAIRHGGIYNDPEAAQKGPNRWSLWLLITTADDGRIIERRTITKICDLSSGAYEVTIGPKPGNGNVTRRCGASMSAWTELKRGSETLGRYEFGNNCHSSADIITEISVRAENPDHPETISVSSSEFHR